MTDLYSIKDVAKIFDISESRLRYWAQTNFLGPSERRGGRWYYRFRDLIQVRAAKELLDAGLSVQRVRKNLDALRALAPRVDQPASRMRIMSDGETVVARDQDEFLLEPLSGQLIMDFSVHTLSNHVADILALPTSQQYHEAIFEGAPPAGFAAAPGVSPAPRTRSVDTSAIRPDENPWARPLTLMPKADPSASEYRPVGDRAVDAYALGRAVHNDQIGVAPSSQGAQLESRDQGERAAESRAAAASDTRAARETTPTSAYQLFVTGYEAEEAGDAATAEACYRRAIERQPTLAAAHTNLGNLLYRQGDNVTARVAYEQALALEPAQAEARYNLGNVLEDLGEFEPAIAEMRRVCWTHPEFADAHYNLGLLLARTGDIEQARTHLQRYLELDRQSEWATRARELLAALG